MTDLKKQLSVALSGRYAIQHELGRSRTSTVFLARDNRHDRLVALKVLLPELTNAVEAKSFLHEIQTTAHLNHPHILTLIDSGHADGLLYFVTPYIEGESLRDRLMWDKQLPAEEAVQICREVADALACAHSHGMVHRDIKPENILLSDGHATVADFGLARAITAGSDEFTSEGEPGVAIGTPAYMSPEQASGSPDVDGRSDIYSLGCVLYEMLAGQPPFTGASVEHLLEQQIRSDPAPISEFRPTLTPEVTRVLERMLSKAAADRFPKASDLVNALPFPSDIRRAASASFAVPTLHEADRRDASGERRLWRLQLAAIALGCTIAIAVGASPWWHAASSRLFAQAITEDSIAVLPFVSMSGDQENAIFADGIHEDILSELGQIRDLKVVSRTTVMPYKRSGKSVEEIGRELRVATILEGSVRRVGNQVRITAQLIDATTDSHVWAQTYDRDLTSDNIFSVQTDVAQEIAQALRDALLQSNDAEHTAQVPGRAPRREILAAMVTSDL